MTEQKDRAPSQETKRKYSSILVFLTQGDSFAINLDAGIGYMKPRIFYEKNRSFPCYIFVTARHAGETSNNPPTNKSARKRFILEPYYLRESPRNTVRIGGKYNLSLVSSNPVTVLIRSASPIQITPLPSLAHLTPTLKSMRREANKTAS